MAVSASFCDTWHRSATDAQPVEGALEWLEKNQDKPLDEIKAAASNEPEGEEGPALQPGEEARSLVCNECGKKFRSHAQAEFHASKSEHVDFAESTEEIAPLTEEQKQQRLQEMREALAAKRSGQSVQEKEEKKRNEVCSSLLGSRVMSNFSLGNPKEEQQGDARCQGGAREEAEAQRRREAEEGEARRHRGQQACQGKDRRRQGRTTAES